MPAERTYTLSTGGGSIVDISSASSQQPQVAVVDSIAKVEAVETSRIATTDHKELKSTPKMSEEEFEAYQASYENLLLMFYNQAPKVSSVHLEQALIQCERVVAVAEVLGSLQIVQHYIGNVLAQYRHSLYAAIAKDPPRWLNLAVYIESGTIFTEAIIHCTGNWPHWPWDTPTSSVKPRVLDIVAQKAKALSELRGEIDRELLMNSISNAEGRLITLAASPESWMIVQVFRDWFARQIYNNRKINKSHHATYYRLMWEGGEAYLPLKTQIEKLSDIRGNGMTFWQDVEEDLNTIKSFATNAVTPLVKNNLMIDAEAAGLSYLTCTEIGREDYPWNDIMGH